MRYSDYLNAVSFHHKTVSYNVLAPKIDPSAPKVDKRLDITLQQSLALIGLDWPLLLHPYYGSSQSRGAACGLLDPISDSDFEAPH